MEKTVWRLKRRKEIMTAPITLPRLDTATLAGLRRCYEETPPVESRTHSQMILLARQAYTVPQIARIVLRSEDTIARVLKRFQAGRAGRGAPGHITRPRAEGHGSVGSREARMV